MVNTKKLERTNKKIGEKEKFKLYSDLIILDILALEESKGQAKSKRNKILNVLKDLESVFTGVYLRYKDVPKPESEESIAERTKLRRKRSDEIAKKEKKIDTKLFREYFKTTGSEKTRFK